MQQDAHLQLKKHKSGGADMFAQLARKKMEEALEEKRRKLAAQLKAQMVRSVAWPNEWSHAGYSACPLVV